MTVIEKFSRLKLFTIFLHFFAVFFGDDQGTLRGGPSCLQLTFVLGGVGGGGRLLNNIAVCRKQRQCQRQGQY